MNARQREILLHMTGLDRSENAYREHYAASEGSPEVAELEELKRLGLVDGPYRRGSIYPRLDFYYTTAAGVEAARAARLAERSP